MRIIYLTEAENDLLDIYVTIGLENEPAAERMVDRIRSALKRLQLYPLSAAQRPEVAADARGLPVGRYVALYRVRLDEVQIVRVVHSAQDIANFAVDFEPDDF